MTDNVLQSFCERCGTRYTSSVPTSPPAAEENKSVLGRFGRRGQEKATENEPPTPSTASPSSDAFAGTFHFCMDCRQYVCTKCWNTAGGGCLTDRPPKPRARSHHRRRPAPPVRSQQREQTLVSSARSARPATSGGTELDEWGRPRKAPPEPTRDEAPKTTFAPSSTPGVAWSSRTRSVLRPRPRKGARRTRHRRPPSTSAPAAA